MSVAIYHYEYGNVKGARVMMETAHDYLHAYRPKFWGLDLEKVYPFIEECLTIFPKNIDRIPFVRVGDLPRLPRLLLYLEDN